MATSLQDVLDKANKKATSGNKQRTVKPRQGRSVWRILPGWDAAEPNVFYHAYGQHFIKGPDGKVKAVVGCQDKSFDEPCEVCQAVQDAARNAPNDKMREQILESRSTQRFLFNAIDVDNDPNKVVILEVGTGLFRDIIANISEDLSIIDADEGRDFAITRDGTGLNTKYSLAVRGKANSISVPKSALMEMNNLSEYVSEDFEASQQKALKALGISAGTAIGGGSAAAALTGPDLEIDDEIPDFDARKEAEKELAAEVDDAEVVNDPAPAVSAEEQKAAEESFGEDVSDDDIEAMLADLD